MNYSVYFWTLPNCFTDTYQTSLKTYKSPISYSSNFIKWQFKAKTELLSNSSGKTIWWVILHPIIKQRINYPKEFKVPKTNSKNLDKNLT